MRFLLFNQPGSTISDVQYAAAMRVSFLLSDHLVYSGRPHHAYALLHYGPGMPLWQKLDVIRKNNAVDDATMEMLDREFGTKNPIVKEQVETVFTAICDITRTDIQREGYFTVEEILSGEGVVEVLPLNSNVEEDTPQHYPYSTWLLLQQNEDDEADINVVTGDFFAHPYIKHNLVNINSEQAQDLSTVYLQTCFQFPHLALLSMDEMKVVREQLKESLGNFRSELHKWCYHFWYEGLEDENVLHFRNDLYPAIQNLQEQMNNNETLKRISRATLPENRLEVLIGEVPVKTIWQYYRDHKIIPDDTWENLQQAVPKDHRLNYRWPVMIVRNTGSLVTSIYHEEEAKVVSMWNRS